MPNTEYNEIVEATEPDNPPSVRCTLVPRSEFGSAIAGLIFSIPLGLVATVLAVYGFELYGIILFCLSPFSVGLGATLIYGYHQQRSLGYSLGVSQLAVLLLAFCIFLFAMEGLICLIMALPLAMCLSAFGGLIGWAMSTRFFSSRVRTNTLIVLVVGLPLLMGFEDATYDEPHRIEVSTQVFVDASPEVVWEHLIDAAALPMPEDTLFRRGVAYPTDIRLHGEGSEATLTGDFTTGPFEVAIDEWDAPHRLAMSVTQHPPTMQEWSIYGDIDAPHIKGYFACESGLIELHETVDGTTLLVGTTQCRQDLGPSPYWSLWSERIIDRLHHHVLEDIGQRAESSTHVDPSAAGASAVDTDA